MLLITPSEVLEYAFSTKELISAASIRTSKIDVAQERFIRPKFGDELFEKFMDGEYTIFVDNFVKPALAHYIRYGVVDELSIQLGDNGAVLFYSDEVDSRRTLNRDRDDTSQSNRESELNRRDEKQTENSRSITDNVTEKGESELKRDTTQESEALVGRVNSETKTGKDSLISILTQQDRGELTKESSEDVTTDDRTQKDSTIIDMKIESEDVNRETTSSATISKEVAFNTINEDLKRTDKGDITVTNTKKSQLTDSSVDMQNRDSKRGDSTTSNLTSELTSKEDRTNSLVLKATDLKSDKVDKLTSTNESGSINGSDSRIESGSASVSGKLQQTIRDNDLGNVSRTRSNPSSDMQRQLIKRRALSDANILIGKAVKYVERNSELFPEYEPTSVRGGSIRGRILF